ncbi:MAG: hypothetical protein WBX25_15100 [Rhodomicrobium sp.]
MPPIEPGINTSFGFLNQMGAGLLNIVFAEAGPVDGQMIIALHGWLL